MLQNMARHVAQIMQTRNEYRIFMGNIS